MTDAPALCPHHAAIMRTLADRGRHPHIRDDDALTHLAADLARNCRECCGHTAAGDYEIGRTR